MLERERELVAIGGVLAEGEQGHGRVVLVEAPAGIGKTSLLRAACEAAAERGFGVLRARASDLECDFAYGCVRQLLEPAVARLSDTERERLFAGAAALSEPLFAPTATAPAAPSADRAFSMLHGLYWLLNNIAAERPVVLTVDDLHWSDAESLRFLAYLAPRLEGLRLVVLASTRPGEGDTAQVTRLATAPETTVVRPGPLSVEATATLCRRRLGDDLPADFASACRAASGGNPFFLEALLREVGEQGIATSDGAAARVRRIGPAAVAHAVLLRLADAPGAAVDLVRVVAVLGDGASLAEATGLVGAAGEEVARAADRLVSLGVLQPAARLEFAHPIVREAIYADISPRERAEAHASAATFLAASGASEERVAAQIALAEPVADPERVELLRRVAADAFARGAPAAAVAWLARALAEPPPAASVPEVLLELGSAELRLATPAAVDHLRAAVETTRDPQLLATAVRLLANALTMSGDADGAVHALRSALDAIEPVDREHALALEAELYAHSQQAGLGARATAAERLERHADLKGATPAERLVLASLAFEHALRTESADQAAQHLERGLAGGRLLREQEADVSGTFYLLVGGLLAAEALDLAGDCLEQALVDAEARASIPAMAFAIGYRGWVAFHRGDVVHAEADAREALDLLTSHDIQLGTTFVLAVLARALLERGDVDGAERALADTGDIPLGMANHDLLEARGIVRLAQGRTREGLADLLEFGRRDELWGGPHASASRWRSRAALGYAAAGDPEQAARLAADDLEQARRWGTAGAVGFALRAVALIEGGSVDRLMEAERLLRGGPWQLERARVAIDLGSALRRARRRSEARTILEDGLRLAERCGARGLAEAARTELRAAGGRSSDPTGTGVEQLTASERRVAELAAAGRSNPEIAQSLFVTRKTVESHLGSVFRKLDISRRAELGHAFAAASADR